jgi:L-threonylcarbamoyladenylate synthase
MNQSQISTDVNEAAQILLSGGIIGLPTETVYGLAACALNQSAVSKVFAVKGRPTSHPLIVHLRPEEDLTMWGVFTPDALRLARAFWPGPLTLLVERTKMVPDWVTGGRDTVALRVPSHPVAIALLQAVNTGLVAPSANKFGKVSPTTAQHVLDDLGDSVDLILDGGSCEVGVESNVSKTLWFSCAPARFRPNRFKMS